MGWRSLPTYGQERGENVWKLTGIGRCMCPTLALWFKVCAKILLQPLMWLWLNHSMVIVTGWTQSNDSSEHWMLTMIETVLTGNRIPNIWNRQWGQEWSLSLFSIIAAVCCVVKNLHYGNGIQSSRDGHWTMEISRCRFLHKRTYNPPDLYTTAQVSSQISF